MRMFSVLVTGVVAAAALALPVHGFAQSTQTLTVTTYNIHSAIPDGHDIRTYTPRVADLYNIADVLTTAGADIIALQEVRNMRDKLSRADDTTYLLNMPLILANILNQHYAFGSTLDTEKGFTENRDYLEWGTAERWTNNGNNHGEYGNAVLSNRELVTPPTNFKLPRGTDEEALKRGDEPRAALRVELKDEVPSLGRVVVYSVHFQHNNVKTRAMQLDALLKVAKEDATSATVFLMGDFNHSAKPEGDEFLQKVSEAGFHDLAAEYAVANNTTPDKTIDEKGRNTRIDYIFSSRPVAVTNVSTIKTSVSDHLPVSATIELK